MKKSITSVVLLLIIGCSPEIVVYTDFDKSYNLADYTTYNWKDNPSIEEGENPLYYNELNDKRIKAATGYELTRKGYLLEKYNPDLLVHYHIIVEDHTEITTDPYGFYGPYWRHTQRDVYSYREGTLILDFMDAEGNNLIWRGWAVSVISRDLHPEEIEIIIDSSIEKIFKEFPKNYGQKALIMGKPIH